jgi:hypothetical protein
MAVGGGGCSAWTGCLLLDVLRPCAWRLAAMVLEVCVLAAKVLREPIGTRVGWAPAEMEDMGATGRVAAGADLQSMGKTWVQLIRSHFSEPWQPLVCGGDTR